MSRRELETVPEVLLGLVVATGVVAWVIAAAVLGAVAWVANGS